MWLWQRKNIHKRHLLWLKLFGVCLFIHCLFLSWVFFVSHERSHTLSLSLHKHIDYSAPILFVPLSQTPIKQKNETMTHRAAPVQQNAAPKISTTAVSSPAKKATIKPTTISPAKAIVDKKVNTPTTPPKQKKPAIKKNIPQETPASNSNKTFKTEEKKSSAPKQKKLQEQPPSNTHENSRELIMPENAQISHDYREVEAMRRTALLQKELITNWKPPIGVPADVSCEIQFTVNANGSVKDITMIQNSGIMMYDIAARHALFSIKMPQWTYNKTITIAFKQ